MSGANPKPVTLWRVVESLLISLPVRVLLGGAFVIAGWMKLFHGVWAGKDPAWDVADTIKAYEILPSPAGDHLIPLLAYVMPWSEIIVGVLLILGLWARPAALVTLAQLLLYTIANFIVMARGKDLDCSCFGELEWPCHASVGWCHAARNGVFILLTLWVLLRGGGLIALDALCERVKRTLTALDDD